MTLPTKDQIEAAVTAVKKTHEHFGYARPLKDYYAETVVWAAICAVMLKQPQQAPGSVT